jgi:hypothetical protein
VSPVYVYDDCMCGQEARERNVPPYAMVWTCEKCGMRNRPKVQAVPLAPTRATEGKPKS